MRLQWFRKHKSLFIPPLLGLWMGVIWNSSVFLPLIFFVFACVLRCIDGAYSLKKQYVFIILPFIVLWHFSAVWWVWNASIGGFTAMTVLGSLIISVPYLLYAIARKINLPVWMRYALWATTLLSLEYVHYLWEFNFPWLNLGNSFSVLPSTIQWISYTGVAGISLWIVIVNLWVHHTWCRSRWTKKNILLVLALIALPMLSSWLWAKWDSSYLRGKAAPVQVVVLQPNIDSYREKFILSSETQLSDFLTASIKAQSQLDSTQVSLWVWPETCIPEALPFRRDSMYGHEVFVPSHSLLEPILSYLEKHPKVILVAGAALYGHSKELGYDAVYNTVLQMQGGRIINSHVKGKLVPGAELMPYHKYLQFLDRFLIDLGGSTLPLDLNQGERNLFYLNDSTALAPIICYESVFGGYVSSFVSKGAQLLCIVTNDDWWGNTPGHLQHFNYGRMRAIENRRYIARSANTGISCIINPYGELASPILHYREKGTIVGNIYPLSTPTFYATHGDYLYQMACVGALLLLLAMGFRKKGTP